MTARPDSACRPLRHLRLASALEGTTLLLLLGLAVPLKHLAGWPQAVSVLGPVHGAAFLFFAWCLLEASSGEHWRAGEIARLLGGALLPFGAWANAAFLRRKEEALQGSQTATDKG